MAAAGRWCNSFRIISFHNYYLWLETAEVPLWGVCVSVCAHCAFSAHAALLSLIKISDMPSQPKVEGNEGNYWKRKIYWALPSIPSWGDWMRPQFVLANKQIKIAHRRYPHNIQISGRKSAFATLLNLFYYSFSRIISGKAFHEWRRSFLGRCLSPAL